MKMNHKLILGLSIILSTLGIAATVYKLLTVKTTMQIEVAVVTLIMYALLIIYILFGYKKPEFKEMKYIIIIFAISLIFDLNYCIALKAGHFFIVTILVMLLMTYIAGRLDKINENRILCVIVAIGMAYLWFNTTKNSHWNAINTSFAQFIFWLDICAAYIARDTQFKMVKAVKSNKSKGKKHK